MMTARTTKEIETQKQVMEVMTMSEEIISENTDIDVSATGEFTLERISEKAVIVSCDDDRYWLEWTESGIQIRVAEGCDEE